MDKLSFYNLEFKCPHCAHKNVDVHLEEEEGTNFQFYTCDDPQDGGCGRKIILQIEIKVHVNLTPLKIPTPEEFVSC